jgi:hypothetical protein
MNMKHALPFAIALSIHSGLYAQVGLINGDFEEYIDCPTGHGQVDLCQGWFTAIISPDYFRCEFLSLGAYPSPTQAYSGEGWCGFLCSMIDPTASECIAQHLNVPLLPGHDYRLTLMAKIPDAGAYTNDCGGVAVYGFEDGLTPSPTYTHASTLPGAMLLGESASVQHIDWQMKEIVLNVLDTVAHLALTIGSIPSCQQYIYIDSLSLYEEGHIGISSIGRNPNLFVRSVPGSDQVLVQSDQHIDRLLVTDALGRAVHEADNVGTTYALRLRGQGPLWISCYTERGRATVAVMPTW